MSQVLDKVPFSEEYRILPAVQNFDCGSEPWQTEISEWLKSADGAVKALTHPTRQSDVWLYLTPNDELVGFASLGGTTWTLKAPYNGPALLNIIPFLAIDRAFWGSPKDVPQEERYSSLIMKSVIGEAEKACKVRGREPLLGLYVHPMNVQAKSFYFRMGFRPYDRERNGNECMVRALAHPITSE